MVSFHDRKRISVLLENQHGVPHHMYLLQPKPGFRLRLYLHDISFWNGSAETRMTRKDCMRKKVLCLDI